MKVLVDARAEVGPAQRPRGVLRGSRRAFLVSPRTATWRGALRLLVSSWSASISLRTSPALHALSELRDQGIQYVPRARIGLQMLRHAILAQ